MKAKKILLILSELFLLSFAFYLYDLHKLATDANDIFGIRCEKVNPPLIAYKNSFLDFADAMKNPGKYSDDQVRQFYYDYIDGMRKYVPEENTWLEISHKFTERWDYKLFMPWYMKKAADLQIKMYEGYRDDAKAILAIGDNGVLTDDLQTIAKEARDRRDKYSQEYFDFSDNAYKIGDLRMLIQKVPPSKKCTPENTNIPNTTGALNEEPASVKEPDITG